MKAENAARVDRHDLRPRTGQHPREAAAVDTVDVNQHGGGRLRARPHRLALLADERMIRRERHLVGGGHPRSDVVDLSQVNRRRIIRDGGRTERTQRQRPTGAGHCACTPHDASSSERRRGTEVLAGLTPTLPA